MDNESARFSSINKGLPHLPVWEVCGEISINRKTYNACARSNHKKKAEQNICKELINNIEPQLPPAKKSISIATDAKSELNLLSQKHQVTQPRYITIPKGDNPSQFLSVCDFELSGIKYSESGLLCNNKKEAEQSASQLVLKAIKA